MGKSVEFDMSLFPVIQRMIVECYGVSECSSINEARYRKFGTKAKVLEPQQLSPTEGELFLHCQRANCVASIWKRALTATSDIPSPCGHGWVQANGQLEIKWTNQKLAPDSLLQFLSCSCKKSGCRNNLCACVCHGLDYTDVCKCNNWTNSQLMVIM